MLTGENGILTNATNANSSNVYYGAEEQVKLAYMSVRTEIMTQTVANASYDSTSTENPDNVTALANIVRKDLNTTMSVEEVTAGTTAGFGVTATGNKINIVYKNPKITAGTISNAKPRTNGEVMYNIKLEKQSAKLELEDSIITGINYGTKTATTIDVGDDLTIGSESFRVLKTDKKTQIIAVPHLNITLDTTNPVQTTTYDNATKTTFTAQESDKYWETGQDDIDWTNDKCLLKPYVTAYSAKLDKATGSTGRVSARLGKYSEFIDSAIILPDGATVTKAQIRNPGATGGFWLGSGSKSVADYVYVVTTEGNFWGGNSATHHYNSSGGVRPVLVIDIS